MSSMSKFNLLTFICLLASIITSAQSDTIRLKNPSFEDTPKRGGEAMDGISGWFDCGKINFPMESPPDIHPNNIWGVNLEAQHGETYLGMVVRDNGTYESISIRIDSMLKAGKTYKFSIYIARAENYISKSRLTGNEANYVTPAVLRIWGGSGFCNERELLAESKPVTNTSWHMSTFEIKPKKNMRSITLSAFYVPNTMIPYCGNILVDKISDIVQISQ